MRTDTVAVRDRLHAVLREADGYLTTKEVGERAGTDWIAFGHYDPNHDSERFSHCDGQRDYWRVSLADSARTYRELIAMEKQGQVFRAVVEGKRQVYWAYVDDVAYQPNPAKMLEEIWATPARDHA